MKPFFVIISLLNVDLVMAQDSVQVQQLALKAYTDVYFAVFSNSLEPNALQSYTTVSPRSHRFGLNVVQLAAAYSAEKIRGNFTWHYGDIAQATWSEEFPAVQEANVGLRLANVLWLDAGFFITHIGTESFLPKNNLLSSTAVATYNEPFYQSGVRLSYEGFEKWIAELWVVSGYNNFLDVNKAKSVGLKIAYQLSDGLSITYTNLLGKESLTHVTPAQFRTYHNVYLSSNLLDQVQLIIGGDFGSQTYASLNHSNHTAYMYNALATVRYYWTPVLSTTFRGEVFNDPDGFISGILTDKQGEQQGLQLWGLTVGFEYKPAENAYVRMEGRHLETPERLMVFEDNGRRWEWLVTMGCQFDKMFEW